MLIIYSVLFYLLLPFIFFRLWWRGFKAPAYRLRWAERLGYYKLSPQTETLWIHAVSVGEAEAAFPLIKQWQLAHPTRQFLVTTTTPTGSARVKAVLGKQVMHVYLPYDIPDAVQRFLKHFKPVIGVIMETEIWPNLFIACGQHQIPVCIINARLSSRSAKGYQKLASLLRQTLKSVHIIAAQTPMDAERFRQIGAMSEQVQVCGNIKFDTPAMDALIAKGLSLRASLFPGRFVWIIASTHKHEEKQFLTQFAALKQIAPKLLLLIVPRHPERFTEVQQLALELQLKVVMRSSGMTCEQDTDVYIGDTMGELKMLYAAADLAFVGGSLVPVGGHNVLEAAAVNVPVMFGPHMANFSVIAEGLLAAEAALQCHSFEGLMLDFERLYRSEELRSALVTRAKAFIARNQGATQQILQMLASALPLKV